MRFKIYIGIVLLIIEINGQIKNNCSDDFRCRCQTITATCSRSSLTTVPRIKENFIVFDLRNNLITKIKTGDFSNLRILKTLYINNNRITSIDANSFYGLDQLKDLYLFGNAIERIHPDAFVNLKNLNSLYLQQNRIKRIESGTFKNLINLERLLLNSNLIANFKEELVTSLTKLKTLRLEDNRLVCDCDMFWLWLAVNPNSNSYRIYNFALNAVCYSPDNLKNKKINYLSKKDFKCVEPIIVQVPKDIEISSNNINNEAKFECKAIGFPSPSIQWFKDGRQLFSEKYIQSENGSSLMINGPNENDVGTYECVAISNFGEARAQASLKINHESIDELEFNHQDSDVEFSNIFIDEDINIGENENIYQENSINGKFELILKRRLLC
ncbi:unnamed protein product [Brachionus calyciflorus]|uniref:Ig-like domain-containing protein n=1 Tax=Brachionus calyciflorus TaxID=104777 RepID=A0A814AWG5_9BILA|nr:unnamed protein product [Brachionus calyciflorus]